ncbi:MAG: Hint domain-containing protein [Paracoccaceae bacterium]
MTLRSFFAIDSANLVVDSSSNASIVGHPVINNSDTPDGTVFTYTAGGGTTAILDDTGGDVDIFEDDDEANHVITDGGGIVANGTEVEAESLIFLRALDINGNPTGPTITITVFSQGGVTGDVWGFSPDILLQDGVSYTKTGGSNIGSSGYNNFITCFGPGTEIDTEQGLTGVEIIETSQRVWTLENGFQPVQWIGRTKVQGTGSFAPVVFAPGAIGNERELVVSQEHRIFFDTGLTDYLFGDARVLVAAKHLLGLPGVALQQRFSIQYTHLMFDRHQIIRSNGTLTESFFLSENALKGVAGDQKAELLALFPSLANGVSGFGPMAAYSLKAREASVLRHYMAA